MICFDVTIVDAVVTAATVDGALVVVEVTTAVTSAGLLLLPVAVVDLWLILTTNVRLLAGVLTSQDFVGSFVVMIRESVIHSVAV